MTTHVPSTGPKKLGDIRRKAVSAANQELVKESFLEAGQTLPLVIEPAVDGVDLIAWAGARREELEQKLLQYGGILFRNFKVEPVADLNRLISAIAGGALEYRERSSPRSQVQGNIYTSTDYPPEYPIFLHNENSYQQTWPLKIFFACAIEPHDRGETPIADVRKVYNRLDPELLKPFAEKGWMYIRNFGDGLGLPWQTVFGTTDRDAIEEYCRERGIVPEWKDGDRLRTRAVRPAITRHPRTGETVWFNHATFFHISTLVPEVRNALLSQFAVEDLPTNTAYGDGTPIPDEVMEQLRAAYDAETIVFPWREGDILMLDNMLAAHARSPFSGPRKILVGMSEPISHEDLAGS
jgi:alpha-ketoglutarate-dependent taurine dioxygenase